MGYEYYMLSILTTSGGTSQTAYGYTTREAALSAYHSTLANNYASTVLLGFCTVLLNQHGGTEAREYWEKPINPTPEPEPTPDVEPEEE